jgi:hypothetical protein
MSNKKDIDFRFWVPLDIIKGKDKEDNDTMKLGGVASTSDKDSDGEILDPNGFDLSIFKSMGSVNWHHMSKTNPSAIIGEPTLAEIRKGKLYVEVELYKDSKMANEVYELAKVFEKNSKTRRLGFSVEGKATERDPLDDKIIKKAMITGLAVTHLPKCPSTLAQIIKGETDGLGIEEDEDEDEEDTKKTKKALSTDSPSGAAVKKEHVDGNEKNLTTKFTKGQIFDKILTDFDDIEIEKANQVYNIIQKISTMNKEKTISQESIDKAYKTLGMSIEGFSKGKESEEMEKCSFKKAVGSSLFKKFKKGEDDKEVEADDKFYKKMEKGGYEEANEEEVKKAKESEEDDDEDSEESVKKAKKKVIAKAKDAEESEEEDEDETEEEEEEKKPIKKAKKKIEKAKESEESEEEEEDETEDEEKKEKKVEKAKKPIEKSIVTDILKAMEKSDNRSNELFKAIGTVLKDNKEKNEEFQKSILDRLEAIEETPAGRKSFSKATERFKDEDLEKGQKVLSVSKNKKELINLLESFTFEKGCDDELAKGMTTLESSGVMLPNVAMRLFTEKGIRVVQ